MKRVAVLLLLALAAALVPGLSAQAAPLQFYSPVFDEATVFRVFALGSGSQVSYADFAVRHVRCTGNGSVTLEYTPETGLSSRVLDCASGEDAYATASYTVSYAGSGADIEVRLVAVSGACSIVPITTNTTLSVPAFTTYDVRSVHGVLRRDGDTIPPYPVAGGYALDNPTASAAEFIIQPWLNGYDAAIICSESNATPTPATTSTATPAATATATAIIGTPTLVPMANGCYPGQGATTMTGYADVGQVVERVYTSGGWMSRFYGNTGSYLYLRSGLSPFPNRVRNNSSSNIYFSYWRDSDQAFIQTVTISAGTAFDFPSYAVTGYVSSSPSVDLRNQINVCGGTPSTATPTLTPSPTTTVPPSATATRTPSATATNSPTTTATSTPTRTPIAITATNTPTITPYGTPTPSPYPTPPAGCDWAGVFPNQPYTRQGVATGDFLYAQNGRLLASGATANWEISAGGLIWMDEGGTVSFSVLALYDTSLYVRLVHCPGGRPPTATPTVLATPTAGGPGATPGTLPFPPYISPIAVPTGVTGPTPDLSIPVPTFLPTWTPAPTATGVVTGTMVIGAIATLQTGLETPLAAVATLAAGYDWERGAQDGAAIAEQITPAVGWLAILNPTHPAWQAVCGPLYAIEPIVWPILPILIVALLVAVIRFVLWLAAWVLRLVDLVLQIIQAIMELIPL